MKKLALIIAFVSGSVITFAQSNNKIIPPNPIEQSKFSFGVKGAFGHSFLIPYKNTAFMPSWDAGISMIYSPFEHLGFGLDGTYSAEGVRFDTDNAETDAETNLNYVRVPAKVIYFFRSYDKDFRPKVSVGPTLGLLTNENDNQGFNKIDFGVSGTLGFNYRMARAIWLNMDASYYQGLIDTYDNNNENDLNGNIRLNLGVSFGF